MSQALLLIDVQNDFMPGGALAVPEGDQIVPVINRVQPQFDLVIATQDWHPGGHLSFASNNPGKKPFEKILFDAAEQTLWPDHCIQGSHGACFHPDLHLDQVATIFRKGMDKKIDSYSAFYDNAKLKTTGLAGYLRERNVNELYFCGLAADICVADSMGDALRLGFKATLIEDACRPLDPDAYAHLKDELSERGVDILSSVDIL